MPPSRRSPLSRRRVLRVAGGAAAVGLAGCSALPGGSSTRGPEHELVVSTVTAPREGSFADRFRWSPITDAFAPQERAVVDRLVGTGSATTVGYHLGVGHHDGERAVWPPQYVRADGTYYRIRLADAREVDREAVVFWFDRLDGRPADAGTARVVTGPPDGLSRQDRAVFEAARERVARGGSSRDVDDESPRHRGFVYDLYDPAESALVPDPPFDYYRHVPEAGESRYFAPRVARPTLTRTQYEYRVEAVAQSREAFGASVRETVVAADFDRDPLPADAAAIVDDLTTHSPNEPPNESHAERAPLSKPFATLLDRLGLVDLELGDEALVTSGTVYFVYGGDYYDGQLTISL
ncbi:MAG: hypothetical protein ABEH78_08345 [Haloferacaceae archaeon]